jgi:hypothetical protein
MTWPDGPTRREGPHCCAAMDEQVNHTCDGCTSVGGTCPDTLVGFSPKFQEYGIWIHDGGTAWVEIAYCPWCGAALPASARDQWFEALTNLGLDPGDDRVPPEFEDERWLVARQEQMPRQPVPIRRESHGH